MFDCKNTVAVCGHRGERKHGIENTMAAIQYAVDLGVDMIETDVRMSKDGDLFLMHNLNLEDLTSGSGYVSGHTYKEMKTINAAIHGRSSDYFTVPKFAHVPLLDEFLDLAADCPGLMLNIDIKDLPVCGREEFAFEAADKVACMVAIRDMGDRTWINSFSGRIIERIFKEYGTIFHYHGFYPWNIMGEMDFPPCEICDMACLLNWILQENGETLKQHTIPCPDSWYDPLLKKGIMPLTVSFYPDFQNYLDAISYGSRVIMADDPKYMLARFRELGFHD